jgi:MSHA biogenesis protein MshP
MSRTSLERGFSLVTALFLLVVLALLGVFIVAVFGLQQSAQALDVTGTRTYAGAQAGVEWALVQVMDPDNNDPLLVPASPQPPACFATQAVPLGTAFSGITVSVSCAVTATTELNRNVSVYLITSTATSGTGTAFPIQRQLTATVSRCTDPSGTAPRYACP